jgi:hypothetical protein
VRVKNLNQTTQTKSGSGSWLAHWEIISGQKAWLCVVKNCINRPSVGGLVQKDGPSDGTWYVVPLCSGCNKQSGQDLDIWDLAKLIPSQATRTLSTMPAFRQYTTSRIAGSPEVSGDLTRVKASQSRYSSLSLFMHEKRMSE